MSDYMDRTLGLGYAQGSACLVASLLCIFTAWKLTTGSLAVERVQSRKAEVFYWVAILFSNTLGTALGDFLADDSGLGFVGGALVIGALLALTLACYFFTSLSRVLLFWCAFVLTRPFGATLGDVLTKPRAQGGLDLGTAGSSTILAATLVAFVAFATWRRSRQPRATA